MTAKEKVQSLLAAANEVTSASDTNLTDGVKSLIDGYGQGGASLSSIAVKKNRYTTYFVGEAFNPTGLTITATYSNGATLDITSGFTYSPTGALTEDDANITASYTEDGVTKTTLLPITVITGATGFDAVLDNNSWMAIHAASERGVGANYWAVGDMHKVTLNGNMTDSSAVTFDNYECNVFIIGFDHNSELEGSGISFHGFKRYNETTEAWQDICLSSARMNTSGTNSGGWRQSRMRYTVLGSTDVINANPTSTCATTPIENSLMSCLPSELRAVLKPVTKYTNNIGNDNTETAVTTTIDYLPLLAEWEIFGSRSYANQYEKDYQARYSYYTAGNSRVKYGHVSLSTSYWWERSPNATDTNYFCYVNTSGGANYNGAYHAYGVAPCFLV